jgi:hypothetical protein
MFGTDRRSEFLRQAYDNRLVEPEPTTAGGVTRVTFPTKTEDPTPSQEPLTADQTPTVTVMPGRTVANRAAVDQDLPIPFRGLRRPPEDLFQMPLGKVLDIPVDRSVFPPEQRNEVSQGADNRQQIQDAIAAGFEQGSSMVSKNLSEVANQMGERITEAHNQGMERGSERITEAHNQGFERGSERISEAHNQGLERGSERISEAHNQGLERGSERITEAHIQGMQSGPATARGTAGASTARDGDIIQAVNEIITPQLNEVKQMTEDTYQKISEVEQGQRESLDKITAAERTAQLAEDKAYQVEQKVDETDGKTNLGFD